MKLRQLILMAFLLIYSLSQAGCASFNKKLKSWLGGAPSAPQQAAQPTFQGTKFSDSGDRLPPVQRQYKRTTKETLSQEASLDQKSGSLWVMEGQGAYLFSQNIVRLVGDPLAITLEGDPKEQLESKVNVINKLLAKIEERQKLRRRLSSDEPPVEKPKEKDAAEKEKAAAKKEEVPPPAELSVKTVPTRIVERTLEGNYRVKGSQPFMIGTREYKIIVTGIVRAEDFNEEGIPATKLLDSKFDIVSARRSEESTQ